MNLGVVTHMGRDQPWPPLAPYQGRWGHRSLPNCWGPLAYAYPLIERPTIHLQEGMLSGIDQPHNLLKNALRGLSAIADRVSCSSCLMRSLKKNCTINNRAAQRASQQNLLAHHDTSVELLSWSWYAVYWSIDSRRLNYRVALTADGLSWGLHAVCDVVLEITSWIIISPVLSCEP